MLDEKLNYSFNLTPIEIKNLHVKIGSLDALKKIEYISSLIYIVQKIWPLYKIYLNLFYKIYFYFFGNNRNPIIRLKKIDKRRVKRLFELIKLR